MASATHTAPGQAERPRSVQRARRIAAAVTDPELPMLTLQDLGVLRGVEVDRERVTVTITPTYSGCPAMATMADDLVHRLRGAGFIDAVVKISLDPPWSSDWITEHGRAALRQAGMSPPSPAPRSPAPTSARDPIPLRLGPTRRALTCPQCGSNAVESVSEFGSTACTAHYRCSVCREPFDHFKEF
ncbi:1,2-phenylacetyl-CoA epoxidase subunit PaaD [Microlunatus soli]|nr:1,2-phenylacetyl-CoA epoxidase subunit PaaD [Microlunatus soli]